MLEKIEVVRCRNCRHAQWSDGGWWVYCNYTVEINGDNEVNEDFYCGYGEYDEDKEGQRYL